MDLEYIKIRNRSIRWLRGMQLAFWPYVFCCLAIFFWMGYNPNHEWRAGFLYIWIGFGLLLNFMLLLGVQKIDVPPVIHKTEECKPDQEYLGATRPTLKENFFDNHGSNESFRILIDNFPTPEHLGTTGPTSKENYFDMVP